MPVFDFVQAGKLAVKVALFAIFATYFINASSEIVADINNFISSSFGLSILSSLNLGCFSDGIGLTEFINNLIVALYASFTTLLGFVSTISMYKASIYIFRIAMGI